MIRRASILVVMLLTTSVVLAQANPKWPAKPVRLYVGFSAGTSTDVVARIIADAITPVLGKPVIVENRAGASATIAANLVAKATPDGYSMVLGTPSAHATAPFVFENLPYDPLKDFAPVALIGNTYYLLVASPETGAKTVKDLVNLAKTRASPMNYGSVGQGSLSHLGGVIFTELTGIEGTHVPYKGTSQSLTDLAAGRIQFLFTTSSAYPFHKSGKARILAVAGPKQSAIPDVPSMAEAGYPDFQLSFWYAVFTTAGTPTEIVLRMNQEINAAVRSDKVGKALSDIGVHPETLSPRELAALILKDAETFRRFVVKAGIKPQAL
jgi:tripartite-type tricarboxylate transporter receptor subunit TctC